MKNLIYQVWVGEIRPGVQASIDNIEAYAMSIGADYYFDHNPKLGKIKSGVAKGYYDWMNPIHMKKFDVYDKIAVLDCDIYVPDTVTDNIFDVPIKDVGICTEPNQPKLRAVNPNARIGKNADEKWAKVLKKEWDIDLPRDEDGLVKVYNAGVVIFSKEGRLKIREKFLSYTDYMNTIQRHGMDRFYWLDQNYFHAMMVKFCDYTEMDNEWNALVHYYGDRDNSKPRPACGRKVNDPRTQNTKFVHIQLSEADHLHEDIIWTLVNLTQEYWQM